VDLVAERASRQDQGGQRQDGGQHDLDHDVVEEAARTIDVRVDSVDQRKQRRDQPEREDGPDRLAAHEFADAQEVNRRHAPAERAHQPSTRYEKTEASDSSAALTSKRRTLALRASCGSAM